MSASYYVLVSEELLDSVTDWESAGLHLIERGGFTEPGMRWCLFSDDNADPCWEGKKVEPTFTLIDGKPVITERRLSHA